MKNYGKLIFKIISLTVVFLFILCAQNQKNDFEYVRITTQTDTGSISYPIQNLEIRDSVLIYTYKPSEDQKSHGVIMIVHEDIMNIKCTGSSIYVRDGEIESFKFNKRYEGILKKLKS